MREKTTTKQPKSSDIALKVEHISKSFHLPTEQSNSIKQAFINRMRGIKGYKKQQVLKDISFEVEKGDFFGIVGRNGSGKSTLLKLISQIYHPDSGKITVNGSLVPFIELGVGFNPELTGRENVYLNGAMLGFSRDEIDDMYDDIVEFAELADFMDQKLKNYSSGMQVRLAFSVAIKAQGDILVLDEVLAVGDEAFQRKCYQYFAELKKDKKTVILVTHDMDSVRRFCNKAIMIEKGVTIKDGNPSEVASSYQSLFMDNDDKSTLLSAVDNKRENKYVAIKPYATLNKEGKVELLIEVAPRVDMEDVAITLEMIRNSGESVYRWVTDENIDKIINLKRGISVSVVLEVDNIFPNGRYIIQVGIKKRDRSENYILLPEASYIDIQHHGRLSEGLRWRPSVQAVFND